MSKTIDRIKYSNDPEMATPSDVKTYFDEGIKQLNKVLIGEEEAKKFLLVASIAGGPGEAAILGGTPGGSKTRFMNAFFKLFEDLNSEDIVPIPIDKDLSPIQIVGGRIISPLQILNKEGDLIEERTEIRDIIGKVNASTKVLKFDEMNRIDPGALNFLLEGIEEGKLTTIAEIVRLSLFMVISTQNGSDVGHSTYPISPANASRQARGVVLGDNSADIPEVKIDRSNIIQSNYKGELS